MSAMAIFHQLTRPESTATGVYGRMKADRDVCSQLISSARRDPGHRFGPETDTGPTEFGLGMDRCGNHHDGNVRRGRRHVCRVTADFGSLRAVA